MTEAVRQITKTIEGLPPAEQGEIFAWIEARKARAWDQRIETDSLNGKLDQLIEEARADYQAGRCRPLDAWRLSPRAFSAKPFRILKVDGPDPNHTLGCVYHRP